jgi:hypothetical protein
VFQIRIYTPWRSVICLVSIYSQISKTSRSRTSVISTTDEYQSLLPSPTLSTDVPDETKTRSVSVMEINTIQQVFE